ncbi:head maturation protease, ClpP-related [Methylobacterium bullatum]|uniref:ATP-dependent Clp protease proteolytic subunit n=1 Tax=Methylobacterium bullatum TaxID=570505 RepID=A0A679K0H6_9HYPH|nr:ATP-dependent Clp protease proteolytic subunit 1 [Methylobacterium bullatum]
MAVQVNGSELLLSGTVGNLGWEEFFTASDVVSALERVGRDQDVTIRINSAGGIATEGAAAHAAITTHRGRKTVIVEGIAASAASVIAMAGDEVVMSLGALMMVHDPSGMTLGTIADHQMQVRSLTALATAMAGVYAEKTGKTPDEARADMLAELWMTAEEAVAAGYADRTLARAAGGDGGAEPTAFDFRLYRQPPERLVALAHQRGWAKGTAPLAAKPTAQAPAANSNCETAKANMARVMAFAAGRSAEHRNAEAKAKEPAAQKARADSPARASMKRMLGEREGGSAPSAADAMRATLRDQGIAPKGEGV